MVNNYNISGSHSNNNDASQITATARKTPLPNSMSINRRCMSTAIHLIRELHTFCVFICGGYLSMCFSTTINHLVVWHLSHSRIDFIPKFTSEMRFDYVINSLWFTASWNEMHTCAWWILQQHQHQHQHSTLTTTTIMLHSPLTPINVIIELVHLCHWKVLTM